MSKGSKRRPEDTRKIDEKWDKIRWDSDKYMELLEAVREQTNIEGKGDIFPIDESKWSKWSYENSDKIPKQKQKRGKRSKRETL